MESKKILVVDDSLTIRYQLRVVLESQKYKIVEADDGTTGLEKLKEHEDIALIISDVHMTQMGGLEFLQNIKIDPKLAKIPFLLLTTEAGKSKVDKAQELGANGWLLKPLLTDKLLTAVKHFVG